MTYNNISIIIVNWHSEALINNCLKEVKKQNFPLHRVIIVNNNQFDFSNSKFEEIKKTKIITPSKNLGFASGNNLALKELTTEEFIIFLNPDVLPQENWLTNLITAAINHKNYATFSSRQMCYGKKNTIDGLGDSYHISGLVWRRKYNKLITPNDMKNREIFSPCAAAALYRIDTLREIGFFDEDYFCYVEDIDLGFRLRLAGYKSLYVPDAVVQHIGSATTGGQHSDFSVYHGHRNLVWTYIKNMPPLLFWTMLPLHLALNIFTVIWFIIKGQGKIILKAKWDAIKGIPRMWEKRQHIQKNRKISTLEIWKALDKTITPFHNHRH